MARSATDVMRDIVAAAAVDAVMALKQGAGGLQNALLRDLAAIHQNTSVADLPPAVQKAIDEAVQAAFTRLKREGYTVAESASLRGPPSRAGDPRPPAPAGGRPQGSGGPRPGRPPPPRGRR